MCLKLNFHFYRQNSFICDKGMEYFVWKHNQKKISLLNLIELRRGWIKFCIFMSQLKLFFNSPLQRKNTQKIGPLFPQMKIVFFSSWNLVTFVSNFWKKKTKQTICDQKVIKFCSEITFLFSFEIKKEFWLLFFLERVGVPLGRTSGENAF